MEKFDKGINMKFSIIIPVYNAEKYVGNSIQSVLNQTYQDFEIVLINDGSVDKSGKICDEYVEKYGSKIKVIHKENNGPLLTRLLGIEKATADYCIFLDADDVLVENALEIIEKAIKKYKNPDMVVYSFYYSRLDGKKEKASALFEEEIVFNDVESKQELYKKFFTSTGLNNVWTKAVKKTVFDGEFPDYKEYAELRFAEDRFHAMGIVTNANKIVCINEPLIEYRLVPESITRTFTVDSISRFNIKKLYQEEKKYLKKWGLNYFEFEKRIDANYMIQTWHIMDLYYNKIEDKKIRDKVLMYNWCEFIPEKVLKSYIENPYLNEQQKQCWKWIIEKDYASLKVYFRKKKIRSAIKKYKKVITKK